MKDFIIDLKEKIKMFRIQPGQDIVQWTSNTNIPRKRRDNNVCVPDWMKGTHRVFMVSNV